MGPGPGSGLGPGSCLGLGEERWLRALLAVLAILVALPASADPKIQIDLLWWDGEVEALDPAAGGDKLTSDDLGHDPQPWPVEIEGYSRVWDAAGAAPGTRKQLDIFVTVSSREFSGYIFRVAFDLNVVSIVDSRPYAIGPVAGCQPSNSCSADGIGGLFPEWDLVRHSQPGLERWLGLTLSGVSTGTPARTATFRLGSMLFELGQARDHVVTPYLLNPPALDSFNVGPGAPVVYLDVPLVPAVISTTPGCGEDCDPGATCGDGNVEWIHGEVCDDGNLVDDDACANDCGSRRVCGDGTIDEDLGEVCDDRNISYGDYCPGDCGQPHCGNGTIEPELGEVCDDGNQNDHDACVHFCQEARICGDGILHLGLGETCDDGNDIDDDACPNDCGFGLPYCGNRMVEPSEACDDGNEVDTDACSNDCQTRRYCGDRVVQPELGEECDDGQSSRLDSCTNACRVRRYCGDGITQPELGEECDSESTPLGECSDECELIHFCGDGIVQEFTGEVCDAPEDCPGLCGRPYLPPSSRLALDGSFGCGLQDNGVPRCWGRPGDPRAVPPPESFVEIAASESQACGLRADGSVRCWGGKPWPDEQFVQLRANQDSVCGLRPEGSVFCWGDVDSEWLPPPGTAIQLDVGKYRQCVLLDGGSMACSIKGKDDQYLQVATGDSILCGIRLDGTADCGGVSGFTPKDVRFTQLSAREKVCGITVDGGIVCFPGGFLPPAGTFSEVFVGRETACAIRSDSLAVCFGRDESIEAVPLACGNGVVEPEFGEACDDGNAVDDDSCPNDCGPVHCGNGIQELEYDEDCDDGDRIADEECTADCRAVAPECGNGRIEPTAGESCEEGEYCFECSIVGACGDGVVQFEAGETCDDANFVDEDYCSNECVLNSHSCGDGIVQVGSGEICDDGNFFRDDYCWDCGSIGGCGDGQVQQLAGEACDEGGLNGTGFCRSDCQWLGTCGDGIVQPSLGEVCDDGNAVSGDYCRSCRPSGRCGDGRVQAAAGEECDDGNDTDDDDCSNACQRAGACGDGQVQVEGGEVCDGEPYCTRRCRYLGYCGDGFFQPGAGEECDDGNGLEGDGCTTDCRRGSGAPERVLLSGDWDGDGIESIGLYDPATQRFALRMRNGLGFQTKYFRFSVGIPEVIPLVGDWNGDGVDTIGLYAPGRSRFYLRDENASGRPDHTFRFSVGLPDAIVLSADWDGDGIDTIAFWGPGHQGLRLWVHKLFLRNSHQGGQPDEVLSLRSVDEQDGCGMLRRHSSLPAPKRSCAVVYPDRGDGSHSFWLDSESGVIRTDLVGGNREGETVRYVVGDWMGDGIDRLGLFDQRTSEFLLYDGVGVYSPLLDGFLAHPEGTEAEPLRRIFFRPDDDFPVPIAGERTPIAGDWDGDGADEVGIYNRFTRSFFLLEDLDDPGTWNAVDFIVGTGTDGHWPVALVGDWDGNGDDTVAVCDEGTRTFYLKNENRSEGAVEQLRPGNSSDLRNAVAGDWDGDGDDNLGWRTDSLLIRTYPENHGGAADEVPIIAYPSIPWEFVPIGDWDGDGVDTPADW